MKSPSRQLTLELPLEPSFGREDFLVSPSNAAAFETFERWPDWPGGGVMLLLGPTGSGKSHLGTIWAERAGAPVLPARELARTPDVPGLAEAGALLIEDADRLGGSGEAEFFHLLNLMRERGGWLAITARAWPDAWGIATRDLLSRLRLAPAVEIGEPDDVLVRAVLVKLFMDRQLAVDAAVIEFLALRIERSLAAARSIVEVLDQEALAAGRAVTRPMASEVLRRLDLA